MARAKQTNRAEARRRYRQSVAQATPEGELPEASEPSGGTPAAGPKSSRQSGQARPSLGAAFREAYHPAHVREDLQALPGLLTQTQPTRIPLTRTVVGIPWFLVSAFLVILGFVALLTSPNSVVSGITLASPAPTAVPSESVTATSVASVGASAAPSPVQGATSPAPTAVASPEASPEPGTSGGQSGALGQLLFQLLSLPPGGPTLPVLLVGFMATRASYLQGLLIGLLDLVLISVYVAVTPGVTGTSTLTEIITSSAITGLPTSLLFAAAAAWYRRFLRLSSPRRVAPAKGAATRGRSSGRPANRR